MQYTVRDILEACTVYKKINKAYPSVYIETKLLNALKYEKYIDTFESMGITVFSADDAIFPGGWRIE